MRSYIFSTVEQQNYIDSKNDENVKLTNDQRIVGSKIFENRIYTEKGGVQFKNPTAHDSRYWMIRPQGGLEATAFGIYYHDLNDTNGRAQLSFNDSIAQFQVDLRLHTMGENTASATRKDYVDNNFVGLFNDQTITGNKTFTSFPLLPSQNPNVDTQITHKGYVDGVTKGWGLGAQGRSLSGLSCNEATMSGFYSVYGATKDTPIGTGPSGSSMIVCRWGSGLGIGQIFFGYGSHSNRTWIRTSSSGKWGSWNEVLTSRNGLMLAEDQTISGQKCFDQMILTPNGGGIVHASNLDTGLKITTSGQVVLGGDSTRTVNPIQFRPNGIEDAENSVTITATGNIQTSVEPSERDHVVNKAYVDDAINALHPIGSVVLRMDATNPRAVYGGTWALCYR